MRRWPETNFDILEKRYARGGITEGEFNRMKEKIMERR
jgi:uncharacterized membrane protein